MTNSYHRKHKTGNCLQVTCPYTKYVQSGPIQSKPQGIYIYNVSNT